MNQPIGGAAPPNSTRDIMARGQGRPWARRTAVLCGGEMAVQWWLQRSRALGPLQEDMTIKCGSLEAIRDPETDKHKKQEEQFVTAS